MERVKKVAATARGQDAWAKVGLAKGAGAARYVYTVCGLTVGVT